MPAKTLRLLFLSTAVAITVARGAEFETPSLPIATANNAIVTVIASDDRAYLISFAGLGAGKTVDDIHARTFVLGLGDSRWREAPRVPGGVGRLAPVAVALGSRAYVFGGYAVASDGSERSTPWVHAFDPVTDTFDALRAMPVPVDDAVAVTYQARYVYLISGWHDDGNVNLVQRYDSHTDTWHQATPLPGPAVFGHAGGIVDNTIVYCDGVAVRAHRVRRRDFAASSACYVGSIDPENTRRIDWRRIDAHPGRPRYRMAAAGVPTLGAVVFTGGSTNPYNYDGVGYDGQAAQPATGTFYFDLRQRQWRSLPHDEAPPTMDHRGLVPWGGAWVTVGGMLAGQQVTDQVTSHRLPSTPPQLPNE
ncbi:MAG: galactose oxidase [Pseudomonadota bacterium]